MDKTDVARCVHCRTHITVPPTYAQGDHIKCGTCGTKHKVVRGDILRLVLADATPLKEALHENERLVERLEDELVGARRSFGIGVNGLGVGVVYALWQVALRDQTWSRSLIFEALGLGLLVGVVLEVGNHFLFAKRHKITRLNAEIEEARAAGRQLKKVIRESSRV
jgi:hypothetical protein